MQMSPGVVQSVSVAQAQPGACRRSGITGGDRDASEPPGCWTNAERAPVTYDHLVPPGTGSVISSHWSSMMYMSSVELQWPTYGSAAHARPQPATRAGPAPLP